MILGFKKQFVPLILDSSKIHTIRQDPKDRWKAGNKIHFATGTRTKAYSQFKEGVCHSVQPILLFNHGNHVYCRIGCGGGITVHNDCVEHHYPDRNEHTLWYKDHLKRQVGGGLLGDICRNDGLSWEDFKAWFIPNENDKFTGKIIHWTDFRYEAAQPQEGE